MTLRQRLIFRAMKRRKKTKSVSGTDIISGLPDDLLLKILLYLPTKVAISTSILSKRWKFLWLWLPKLKYGSEFYSESEYRSLQSFLDRTLSFHQARVIESFHLDLAYSKCFKREEIKLWILLALCRRLRKLKITYYSDLNEPYILPYTLFNCNSLVTLELNGHFFLDAPRMTMYCLPSLKNLDLAFNKFLDGESLQGLLSICPVLEKLFVDCEDSKRRMGLVTINVPSLLHLSFSIRHTKNGFLDGFLDGLVIDTPSLESLEIKDQDPEGHSWLFETCMPNLEEVHYDFEYHHDISSLFRIIPSVKHLWICLWDVEYGGGFIFSKLEHLKLCVCYDKSFLNLFAQLLEDSPNLRILDLSEMDHCGYHEQRVKPTTVGEYVMSSLQAYDWSKYLNRRPKEKDLAIYILGKRWSPNN